VRQGSVLCESVSLKLLSTDQSDIWYGGQERSYPIVSGFDFWLNDWRLLLKYFMRTMDIIVKDGKRYLWIS